MGIGPTIAAFVTAIASSTGSLFVWYRRAARIRTMAIDHLETSIVEVIEVLRWAKDLVLGVPKRVVDATDEMVEEQRPALDKVRELESTLDVDVPDPSDLKKP